MLNLEQLKVFIANYKKGTYRFLETSKIITLKDKMTKIVKTSNYTCRLGVNYGNLKEIKERQKNETNSSNRKPTEWLIRNFVSLSSTGKKLLYVYTTKRKKKSNIQYTTVSGRPLETQFNKIDFELFKELCLAHFPKYNLTELKLKRLYNSPTIPKKYSGNIDLFKYGIYDNLYANDKPSTSGDPMFFINIDDINILRGRHNGVLCECRSVD